MKINLKKILVSLLVIVGFVLYAVYQRYSIEQQLLLANASVDKVTVQTTNNSVSSTTVSPAGTIPPDNSTETSVFVANDDEGENDDDNYVSQQQTTTSSSNQTGSNSSSTTSTTSGGSSPTTTTTTTRSTTSIANAVYKDGQYDGSIADAHYGLVQVRAIIQGGKLTDVVFLSYPNDRSYSISLNNSAMPILKAEAIKVQSANVNIVTGATNTSRAFIESLSNALSQGQI
jgi:uncharacterized protein with FMN-binding domain